MSSKTNRGGQRAKKKKPADFNHNDKRFTSYLRFMAEQADMVSVERKKVVTTLLDQRTYDVLVDTFKNMSEAEKDNWLNVKLKYKW